MKKNKKNKGTPQVERELIKKGQLDEQVANLLGKKKTEVSAITSAFLQETVQALATSGAVFLTGLGRLMVVVRRGTRVRTTELTSFTGKHMYVPVRNKYYVVFKRAVRLTTAIKANRGSLSQTED